MKSIQHKNSFFPEHSAICVTLSAMHFTTSRLAWAAPALVLLSTLCATGASAQSIGLYLSPPGQQNTSRSGAIVETFDRGAGPIGASGNWAIGSYTAGAGQRADADRYGGAGGTGQYLAVQDGPIDVKLQGSNRKYVGFWWSAGDSGNTIEFYDTNDNLLATFTTATLVSILDDSVPPPTVTAIDGNPYPKVAYYGNPNPPAGRNGGEPYGYLNLVLEGTSVSFGRIVITGIDFELDNMAIADTVPVDTSWVGIGNQPIAAPPDSLATKDDTLTTLRNTPASGDVSANDTVVPGATFSVPATGTPTHGTVVMQPNGTYTYTPNTGFSGEDTFSYQVCKPAPNQTECASATVRISVAPEAVDDKATTVPGAPVSGSMASNDIVQPGSTYTVAAPPNGLVFQSNGNYTYTPPAGVTGTVEFDYTVCLPAPNTALCDTAKVTITVVPQEVPVASNVSIVGTPQIGQPVSGSYVYSDANNDVEEVSTFRWIVSSTGSPVGGTQVSDARSYTPTGNDIGRKLFFCVTPVAATGLSPGAEVCSAAATVPGASSPTPIPTLSEWAMLALSALIALGVYLLRLGRSRLG